MFFTLRPKCATVYEKQVFYYPKLGSLTILLTDIFIISVSYENSCFEIY